jgi:hypothetical protein
LTNGFEIPCHKVKRRFFDFFHRMEIRPYQQVNGIALTDGSEQITDTFFFQILDIVFVCSYKQGLGSDVRQWRQSPAGVQVMQHFLENLWPDVLDEDCVSLRVLQVVMEHVRKNWTSGRQHRNVGTDFLLFIEQELDIAVRLLDKDFLQLFQHNFLTITEFLKKIFLSIKLYRSKHFS